MALPEAATAPSDGNEASAPIAWILVKRRRVMWRDRFRAYVVLIDDVDRGRLRDGEQAAFEVEAGSHSVRIKIDWTGSGVLVGHVASGETARFECGPAGSFRSALWRALVPEQYIALEYIGSGATQFERP